MREEKNKKKNKNKKIAVEQVCGRSGRTVGVGRRFEGINWKDNSGQRINA